jgi:drug/metabolite transporter (DMT)-like permease
MGRKIISTTFREKTAATALKTFVFQHQHTAFRNANPTRIGKSATARAAAEGCGPGPHCLCPSAMRCSASARSCGLTGATPMPRLTLAQTGLLLLIAGAAVDSTSGLFTRLLPTDGFTTAAGRGLMAFVFLLIVLLARERGNTLRSLTGIGLWGLAFVVLNAVGMVTNILSLSLTTVANFFMIFATAPFVAALAAWLVLGERVDRPTLLAALAGFVGIAVMMFTGARSGALLGDVLALFCVLLYSALVLVLRRNPKMEILPVVTLTVLASGLIALPLADFSAVGLPELGILAVFGVVQLAIGNLLIFSAASRIPAAQSGLLGILNAGFAPLWVFFSWLRCRPPRLWRRGHHPCGGGRPSGVVDVGQPKRGPRCPAA